MHGHTSDTKVQAHMTHTDTLTPTYMHTDTQIQTDTHRYSHTDTHKHTHTLDKAHRSLNNDTHTVDKARRSLNNDSPVPQAWSLPESLTPYHHRVPQGPYVCPLSPRFWPGESFVPSTGGLGRGRGPGARQRLTENR